MTGGSRDLVVNNVAKLKDIGRIMAIYMCSRAFLGTCIVLEAFLVYLRTCSFQDSVEVRFHISFLGLMFYLFVYC